MIVRVQGGSAPEQREGFLALRLNEQYNLVPITGNVEASADQATRQCIESIGDQLLKLDLLFEQRIDIARQNLARLSDSPGPDDTILIKGHACKVDDRGAITMPAEPIETRRRRQALSTEIDEKLYRTLRKALKVRKKRPEAIGLMVDYALEMPLELLALVGQTAPSELGKAAEFMVKLYRSQGVEDAASEPIAASKAASEPGKESKKEEP